MEVSVSSTLGLSECSHKLLYSVLQVAGKEPLSHYPPVLLILSSLLDRVVAVNDRRSPTVPSETHDISHLPSVFHGQRSPGIVLARYVERIFKYAACSPACFLVAYIYLDRLTQHNRDVRVTALSVHRLLVTSVMLAAKFLDDAYFNNAYYARVAGVSTTELNCLELEFLFRVDFQLHVSTSQFESYCTIFERELRTWERRSPLVRLRPLKLRIRDHIDSPRSEACGSTLGPSGGLDQDTEMSECEKRSPGSVFVYNYTRN